MLMLHFCQHHTDPTIHNYDIYLRVNGLEALHRYVNRVTTGQARIKGHLSFDFETNIYKCFFCDQHT